MPPLNIAISTTWFVFCPTGSSDKAPMKLTEEEKASYLSLCSMAAGGSGRDPKLTQFVSTRRGVLTLEMTQAKPATINFKFEYQTVESKLMIQIMCKVLHILKTCLWSDEATCGETMDQTQFLFKSLQFPSPIPNNTMNCGLKVDHWLYFCTALISHCACFQIDHECDFPVCQLRLDFLEFEIAPPNSGNCNRDQFIIRADEPLPILCGKKWNQFLT